MKDEMCDVIHVRRSGTTTQVIDHPTKYGRALAASRAPAVTTSAVRR